MTLNIYRYSLTWQHLHTGEQSIRFIEKGYPIKLGDTLRKKIDYLIQDHDHLRKLLIWELRGHFGLFVEILVQTDHPEAMLYVQGLY